MYQIAKNKLNELYGAISAKEDLFLPVQKAGQTNYGLWTEEAVVDIDTLKTVKSGKDCFFPQSEVLYKSRYEGGKVSIDPAELQNQPFVVFGMRACDVRAVKVLDQVFLTDPVDTYYAARREHGTIVSLACNEPEETCFCKNFDVDAAEPGADVETWMVGESLVLEVSHRKRRDPDGPCERSPDRFLYGSCGRGREKGRGAAGGDSRHHREASSVPPGFVPVQTGKYHGAF